MEYLTENILRLQTFLSIPLYAVGGCVRDTILGRQVKDYDFTTSANPEEIEAAIKKVGKKVYPIGKRFGTLSFKDDVLGMIEITTFRGEFYTLGSRKPKVTFVNDLEQDLSRRDFTINAIAVSSDGKIHDPFHGMKDMSEKNLRCVGDPNARLSEDPLRMLRCIRFSAEIGYAIEKDVEMAMETQGYTLLSISRERIVSEIDKMFASSIIASLLSLYNNRLLEVLFPEFHIGMQVDLLINIASTPKNDAIIKGWSVIFEYLANCLMILSGEHIDEQDEIVILTRKRRLIYDDLVDKYSLHYKFSKARMSMLKAHQLLPIQISDINFSEKLEETEEAEGAEEAVEAERA